MAVAVLLPLPLLLQWQTAAVVDSSNGISSAVAWGQQKRGGNSGDTCSSAVAEVAIEITAVVAAAAAEAVTKTTMIFFQKVVMASVAEE